MSSHDNIPATAQLVVIGAGPGGYAAAFRAAELGREVTLIDPEANPGGVCLHRGCIPSKALLHVAKLVSEAEESAAIGVTFAKPQIDLDAGAHLEGRGHRQADRRPRQQGRQA